jgi:hypothetical protein
MGALAINCPAGSNKAQEKSSLSRMLTLVAVFFKTSPICCAKAMKREA